MLRFFLAGYFGDILAGALLLAWTELLLTMAGRRPPGVLPTVLFLLACGVFWELFSPLLRPGAVADPLDLAAYLAGGLLWHRIRHL